jgi:hypothetical protein
VWTAGYPADRGVPPRGRPPTGPPWLGRLPWHHRTVHSSTDRSRRSLLAPLLAATLSIAMAGPALGAGAGYRLDLASPTDFVRQYTNQQCIGASLQMMLNILGPSVDRTARTQRQLWDLAKELSWVGGEGPARTHHPDGATARGWLRALRQLDAGPYVLWTAGTYDEALRTAVHAIATTRRPVGLLVWTGDHAWVMSGFAATADPATTDAYAITSLTVLDPWYPRTSRTWGRSPAPGSRLTPAALASDLVAWQGRVNRGWNDRYVLIVPVTMPPTPASPRLR